MTDESRQYKESYKDLSYEKLLSITILEVPHHPKHIAAMQELGTRENDLATKQYETEKSTNILTKYILALTVIILVMASVQLAEIFGVFSTNNVVPVNAPSTVNNAKNTPEVNDAKEGIHNKTPSK